MAGFCAPAALPAAGARWSSSVSRCRARVRVETGCLRRGGRCVVALAALPPAAAPWAVTSVLLAAASAGVVLERTAVGAALSAPLVTMFATLALANAGVLPPASPIYAAVTRYVVPLAVPLLLFNADMRRALTQTGSLLRAFLVGTLATLVGTLVAWRVVPLADAIGAADSWKIAAALCARHIGGAVNYVATAEATGAGSAAVAAGIAADNVIVALYFLILFVIARRVVYRPVGPMTRDGATSGAENAKLVGQATDAAARAGGQNNTIKREAIGEDASNESAFLLVDAAIAVALSALLCTVGTAIASWYLPQLGSIPVITALVVALATLFPRRLSRLRAAGSAIGIYAMQVFFAATGASGSILAVLKTAPMLFAFSSVQLAAHLAVLLLLGRVMFRLKLEELLLASNANVGGPTTAAGMAAAKRWQELIVPSLLVGVFGYAVATFLSLGLGHAVLKPTVALRSV